MKKLIFSMLAMAAMVSCSNEGDPINEVIDKDGLVPVVMNAGIGSVTTKAAIEQGEDGALTKALPGVSFLRSDKTADWTTLGTPIEASIGTDGTITFTAPAPNYEKDGSTSHFFGYYPAATVAGGTLAWDVDGTKDIIISGVKSGDKTTITPLSFTFAHQLTQLKFNIKAGVIVEGETLTSITVKDQLPTATYTATGAKLVFSGTKADLSTEGLKFEAITTEGISGGTLLLPPTTVPQNLNIEVVTTTGENKKTYKGAILVGSATNTSYNVNLTISQQAVTGDASIGEWNDGGNAEGEVI